LGVGELPSATYALMSVSGERTIGKRTLQGSGVWPDPTSTEPSDDQYSPFTHRISSVSVSRSCYSVSLERPDERPDIECPGRFWSTSASAPKRSKALSKKFGQTAPRHISVCGTLAGDGLKRTHPLSPRQARFFRWSVDAGLIGAANFSGRRAQTRYVMKLIHYLP